MVNKQIKIKKGVNSITGLVMTLLIVVAIFSGLFLYWNDQANEAGTLTIDSKYSSSYNNLTNSSESLEQNVEAIRANLNNITEADNTYQVALNGLKGLGNTLKLPISFISDALGVHEALKYPLSIIPGWALGLLYTGILVFIVLLILAALKGEPKLSA